MNKGTIGNKEIQIIHIAKNQLMMPDDEYRIILKSLGVSTSKDLTYHQYDRLLQIFRTEGFIITSKKKIVHHNHYATSFDRKPMLKKIGALLNTMKLNWGYADSIAKHMFKVDITSWCTPAQLHSIVAALEYKRQKIVNKA